MPTKIMILNDCSMCSYKIWNGKERVCRLSGYKIIDTPLTEIPGWCELKDYAKTEKEIKQETKKAKV